MYVMDVIMDVIIAGHVYNALFLHKLAKNIRNDIQFIKD